MQTRVFSGNMMMPIVTAVYCALFITTRLSSIEAFSNAKPFLADQPTAAGNIIFPRQLAQPKSTSLFAEKKKKVGGLDENVRNKLVSESIAPWRTLRLFFYFSLGSGALIGGFIALTGTLAAISNGQADAEDFDMNAQYLNLAIDFGAVLLFGLLAKFDFDKKDELDTKLDEKIAKKKERKKLAKGMQEREEQFGRLSVEVQVSVDGATKSVSVKELQAGASQHMIVVVGNKKACRDALIGANLMKMDFAMSNVLVIPVPTDVDLVEEAGGGGGGGFGDRPIYEKQAYVTRPVGEGWDDFVEAEMKDAITQGGEKASEEGIAIVVANNGKVIRRGIGKVPWRQMVEQLNGNDQSKEDSSFLNLPI